MPNKRKICTENNNTSQNIFIPSLNTWYPIENVINSAYRKILDFKENAEKILEKEKLETLSLCEFAKAIYDSRSFNISLQHYCIVLKCYITLEKDKDAVKKKRDDQTQSITQKSNQENPLTQQMRFGSSYLANSDFNDFNGLSSSSTMPNAQISGGAKKVNVEVIMRSNPFRVDENEKSTKMELIRDDSENGMLRFTYYVKPEFEARKINRETNQEMFENGKLIVFTNDFFTVYKNSNNETEISLNEIVQSDEEQKRTEALGEKLCVLLKDRPRHRALLTNECKLNSHTIQNQQLTDLNNNEIDRSSFFIQQQQQHQQQLISSQATQEDETYYTRELINIYGQPIVPSFHKQFNYQLSNTHYGYRTLRRLLNCDILKNLLKRNKNLDRVVEFVQLTTEKCLNAFEINLTTFYDPLRFQNGIVKEWLDIWYVECLKKMYNNKDALYTILTVPSSNKQINKDLSNNNKNNNNDFKKDIESNHLWFCLEDYGCKTNDELILKIKDYITITNNRSELILVHTLHPVFEYQDVLSEVRRLLAMCLSKSIINISLDEIISIQLPIVARQQVEILLTKYINFDSTKRITSYTPLFEILMIIRRELCKDKNDEIKYCQFLYTIEKYYQDKLRSAIMQLKCVPCLNKYMSNIESNTQQMSITQLQLQKQTVTHANMLRLIKQMSSIVITELQYIAIDLIEKQEDEKLVKYIRLKDELKQMKLLQFSQSTPLSLASVCSSSSTTTSTSTVYESSSSSLLIKGTPILGINNTQLNKPQSSYNITRNLSAELASISTTTSNYILKPISTKLNIQQQQQLNNKNNKSDQIESSKLLTPQLQSQQKLTPTLPQLNLFNPHLQLITDKLKDMSTISGIFDDRMTNIYKNTNRF